jgi:hypothetical protein
MLQAGGQSIKITNGEEKSVAQFDNLPPILDKTFWSRDFFHQVTDTLYKSEMEQTDYEMHTGYKRLGNVSFFGLLGNSFKSLKVETYPSIFDTDLVLKLTFSYVKKKMNKNFMKYMDALMGTSFTRDTMNVYELNDKYLSHKLCRKNPKFDYSLMVTVQTLEHILGLGDDIILARKFESVLGEYLEKSSHAKKNWAKSLLKNDHKKLSKFFEHLRGAVSEVHSKTSRTEKLEVLRDYFLKNKSHADILAIFVTRFMPQDLAMVDAQEEKYGFYSTLNFQSDECDFNWNLGHAVSRMWEEMLLINDPGKSGLINVDLEGAF